MDESTEGTPFIRTVRYRLYPNATQERSLEETLSTCCGLYNRLLEGCRVTAIEGGAIPTSYDMMKQVTQLKKSDPFLKEAPSYCTRDVCTRVAAAMSGCEWRKDGRLDHLPRFKSSNRYHSFTYNDPNGFGFKGDRLHLSKIGDIRYRNDHHPKGEMRTCVIDRDAKQHWYAIITYRMPRIIRNEEDLEHPSHPEAYDLGLHDVITDSSGCKVRTPNFYSSREDEIANLQNKMASVEKDDPRYDKYRRKLAKIHQTISRQRRGFLHKLSRDMVDGHTAVIVEDLDVKKMILKGSNTHGMRKSYTEASWGGLIRMTEAKAEEAGIPVVKVDPRNTSKTCSQCGHVKAELPLSERTYRCERCGSVLDRDHNAALNILGLGMQSLRQAVNGTGVSVPQFPSSNVD